MRKDDLLKVYKTIILPSVEYSSVIYGCMIPDYLSNKLESVQKQALKIIFGWDKDYNEIIASGEISTLAERRKEATLNFAIKTAASPRFGPLWFKKSPETEVEVRPTTRKHYVERFCRTERSKSSPINYMTRLLNEYLSKLETKSIQAH